MGGGALAAASLSISDVRVEFGQADFPLRTNEINRRILKSTITFFVFKCLHQLRHSYLETVLLVGSDDHVAFGLTVVAHALHAVNLGQVMDDLPVFSVHGRETVTLLWLFSLQTSVMRYYTQKLLPS